MIVDGAAEVQAAIITRNGRQQKPRRNATVGESAAGDGCAGGCLNGTGIAQCTSAQCQRATGIDDAAAGIAQVDHMPCAAERQASARLNAAGVAYGEAGLSGRHAQQVVAQDFAGSGIRDIAAGDDSHVVDTMNLAAVAQRCAAVAGGGQVEKVTTVDIARVGQRCSA